MFNSLVVPLLLTLIISFVAVDGTNFTIDNTNPSISYSPSSSWAPNALDCTSCIQAAFNKTYIVGGLGAGKGENGGGNGAAAGNDAGGDDGQGDADHGGGGKRSERAVSGRTSISVVRFSRTLAGVAAKRCDSDNGGTDEDKDRDRNDDGDKDDGTSETSGNCGGGGGGPGPSGQGNDRDGGKGPGPPDTNSTTMPVQGGPGPNKGDNGGGGAQAEPSTVMQFNFTGKIFSSFPCGTMILNVFQEPQYTFSDCCRHHLL
jgi:hypothetical protein